MPNPIHTSRDRAAFRAGAEIIRRQPMTPTEVRGKFVAALDELNHFIEKHKDIYNRYKQDFQRIGEYVRDPSLKKQAIEDLTLAKYPRLFAECVRLYSQVSHWQEQCTLYKVDDAVVLALQDDLPSWLQFLKGSDHKFHPNHTPVKGKTFLPKRMRIQ
jgi:hypothetical protein